MELFLSRRHDLGGRIKWTRIGPKGYASRRCRFEQMESRQLLAADLAIGAAAGQLGHTGGPTGSIGGHVFATEAVGSCESHGAANRLAGVRVELLDASGAVIEASQTDEQGAYHFSDLIPGQYAVRQPTPTQFFVGASHVGAGGGPAIARNQVREILLQAGEALAGYNFCHYAIPPEPAGPIDGLMVPVLTLSLEPTATAYSKVILDPAFVVTAATPLAQRPPLVLPHRSTFFDGFGRTLKEQAGIKAWDDDPFDNWFATASYWELANVSQTALVALEPLLEDAESSSNPLLTARDTAISASGWQSEARITIDQLMDDGEIIRGGAGEAVESAAPQLARRRESARGEENRHPATGQQDTSEPTRGRAAEQDRIKAVDRVMAHEYPA